MTSLTPVISSNYNPVIASLAHNHTFVPVNNAERTLYAMATYDVGIASATGQNGATFINNTNTYNGNWYAIQILADSTFQELDCNWDGSAFTGVVFKADHTLYGNFTKIKLTSGTVIAYKQ